MLSQVVFLVLSRARTQVLILHWLQPRAPMITTTQAMKVTMTFSLGSQELPLWRRHHRRVHLLFSLLVPLLVLLLTLQRTLVLVLQWTLVLILA